MSSVDARIKIEYSPPGSITNAGPASPKMRTILKNQAAAQAQSRPSVDFGILDSLFGFHIRMAQVAVYDDFLKTVPVPGFTPGQFAIIVLIDRNPNITQQELAESLGADKSTLVGRLHRLEALGMIERVRANTDRRANWLRLTRPGKATLKKMMDFVKQHERRIGGRLSVEDGARLLELLQKIG